MDYKLGARFGAVLGGAVFVWQLVAGALGVGSMFIPIATGLEAAVLIAMFSRPATGSPMGPRIAAGALASLIGAVAAFAGSLLCSQVLFPDLLATLGPNPPTALDAAGGGFMGTLVTGIALSAALAFMQRKRVHSLSEGGA